MKNQIIVFSDSHFSKNWDTIDQCLGQTPSSHSQNYLNPNQELRKFVDQMNQSSHVQAVINNGDSIDYHFSDFMSLPDLLWNRQDSARTSNWDLFNGVINRLKKPYVAIPGNHDYRKEAYNYTLWGTRHVNLSDRIRKKHKHQIGHQRFRGPWELSSIMVNEKKFNPLSKGMFIKTREDMTIADFHCIFLDNGSDAFVRAGNLMEYCKKILKTRMISFDSDGLHQEDLNYVSRVLSRNITRDILIFQHAPLINPQKSCMGKKYQLSIDRFDTLNCQQKINYSTILNGGSKLLNILRNSNKNIVLIASHIHHSKYFLIDKKTLVATEVSNKEFNKNRHRADTIKQLTTLPLGGICPGAGGNKTGFLKVSPDGFEEKVLHTFA